MKKIIFAVSLVGIFSSGSATAQVSFGPEAGLNLSSLSGKGGGKDNNSGIAVGARVGGVADIGLTNAIFLRPGIEFSLMGGKNGDLGDNSSISISYIHIPVNVLYKLGEEGDGRFYFGITPYMGVAIGGKLKTGGNSADLEIGDDKAKDLIKRFDFGAGVKVGYEFPVGFCIDASFLQGFANIATGGDADNSFKNRLISIGGSYFFGRGR